jgi:hypothetical protein
VLAVHPGGSDGSLQRLFQVLVVHPGLYRVSSCTFAGSGAAVRLLLNGVPIFTCTEPAGGSSGSSTAPGGGSAGEHPKCASGSRRSLHPTGDVTGLTIDEFVALPSYAKVLTRPLGRSLACSPARSVGRWVGRLVAHSLAHSHSNARRKRPSVGCHAHH